MKKTIITIIIVGLTFMWVSPALAAPVNWKAKYDKLNKDYASLNKRYKELDNTYTKLKFEKYGLIDELNAATNNYNKVINDNKVCLANNQSWETAYNKLRTDSQKSSDSFAKVMNDLFQEYATKAQSTIDQYKTAYNRCIVDYKSLINSQTYYYPSYSSSNNFLQDVQNSNKLQDISKSLDSILSSLKQQNFNNELWHESIYGY